MKPYVFPLLFGILTTTFSLAEEDPILFNTSEVYDKEEIRPGFEMWAVDEVITQPFFTGDSDSIVSVELDVRILTGSPTGRMIIEIWDDDGNGKPSEKVGTFGSVLVNDLPTGSKRPVVHTTVEGLVSDLKPQSHYHVLMNHSEVVFRPPLERDKVWYTTYRSDPESSGAGRAAARGDFTGNQWKTLESILDGAADRRFLVMKVVGAKSQPVPAEHTITLTPSDQGTATKSPDIETYPTGAEVTLTATPNEDYEFVRWLNGEEELTANPLTITIQGDTTITPEFTERPKEIVIFNTDVYDKEEIRPGFEMWAVDEVITQPFFTGDSDSIVSVELDVRILTGSPTGRMIIEIWDDDGNGKPSEKVGTFGSVLVNDLPTGSKRPVVHTTVEGLVSDLKPQSHYHVLMNHSEVVFRPPLERDKVWYTTYGSDPESSGAGRAAARGDFTGNQWKTLESILDGAADRRFLVMKVIGAKSQPVPAEHTITLTPSDQGTVTKSPDIETYPTGAEVTLTATPNEDYEFVRWLNGEEELTANPLTITIQGDTTITPEFTERPKEIVIFNTDVYDKEEIRPGFEMWAVDEVITQPFFTGDSDSIVSVELDVRILTGSPTGRMIIEIWDDDGNGKPSEKVGTFGSVLVNDLPTGSKRPVVHTTVEGLVSDLKPQSHYHVLMNHSEVVFRPPLERDKVWYTTYGSDPESSGAGRAAARGDFTGNQWKTLESILDGAADRRFLVMKVVGAKSQPVPAEHTITLTPSDQGTVTKSPDIETYPTGTEVTLTATPNDGYEFSKWIIDEDEFTDSPLIITIEADTTITPEFAKIPATFTLTIPSDDGGTVVASPDMEIYPAGTVVTLTATPNEGYTTAGWEGDTSEEGNPPTITLTMDGDKNATATFRALITPEIAGVVFDPDARSVSLTWPSHPDAIYEIEMSTNLVGWESLGTQTSTGDQTTAVVDMPGNDRQRFYRLREKP